MNDVDNSLVVRRATRRERVCRFCFVSAFWLLVSALWVGAAVSHAPVAHAIPCQGINWSPNAGTVGTQVTAQGFGLNCSSHGPANPLTLYVAPGNSLNYLGLCSDPSVQHVTVATVSYDPSTGNFTTTFAWPAAAAHRYSYEHGGHAHDDTHGSVYRG
jgi:hypothetical protein